MNVAQLCHRNSTYWVLATHGTSEKPSSMFCPLDSLRGGCSPLPNRRKLLSPLYHKTDKSHAVLSKHRLRRCIGAYGVYCGRRFLIGALC